MRDWLDYRLSDLLLFSPRTYYRMFEIYHRDVWPAQVIAAALVIAVALMLSRPGAWRDRAIAGLLALAWLWVGVMFHYRAYASINWAATYFGGMFIAQAILIGWLGVARRPRADVQTPAGVWVSPLVWLVAALVPPLASWLAGRSWEQVEVFGLTPDATAIATVALVVLRRYDTPRAIVIVPLVWCVIGAATMWALGSTETWYLIAGAAIALGALARRR